MVHPAPTRSEARNAVKKIWLWALLPAFVALGLGLALTGEATAQGEDPCTTESPVEVDWVIFWELPNLEGACWAVRGDELEDQEIIEFENFPTTLEWRPQSFCQLPPDRWTVEFYEEPDFKGLVLLYRLPCAEEIEFAFQSVRIRRHGQSAPKPIDEPSFIYMPMVTNRR